jgi:DnaK suppressor protein
MTRTQLRHYKNILEARKTEIEERLRRLDEIAVERTPDQMDQLRQDSERELAIANLDRESRLHRLVRAALERIAEGGYGTCTNCEEAIAPARLSAVPWTPFCLDCQEAADRQGEKQAA